jgi:hypothetical protein
LLFGFDETNKPINKPSKRDVIVATTAPGLSIPTTVSPTAQPNARRFDRALLAGLA